MELVCVALGLACASVHRWLCGLWFRVAPCGVVVDSQRTGCPWLSASRIQRMGGSPVAWWPLRKVVRVGT